jgi:hypothetical protein
VTAKQQRRDTAGTAKTAVDGASVPQDATAAVGVADDAPAGAERFRERIVEMRRVRAGDIEPHPQNPRTHSGAQMGAVTGMLVEVGKFRPLIAFPADGLGPAGDFNRLMYADGHCREKINPDEIWTVCVTDLTRAEADKALFADATGEMAGYDPVNLDALMREVETGCEELAGMLTELAGEAGLQYGEGQADEPELKQLDTLPPPQMSWALIGIPTVRFGEIAETLELVAEIPGVILETTSNDG